MRAVVTGAFHAHDAYDGSAPDQAWLTPAQTTDVHHARHLCAEYGVSLALDHSSGPDWPVRHAVCWVDPCPNLRLCERLTTRAQAWFVQPGCLLGQLDALGLPGFRDLPQHLSVAAWVADRMLCNWATGHTARSGISHLSVLLADGNSIVLGPFGEHQQTALTTASQRRLVTELFTLLGTPAAQHCLQAPRWPGQYRLDALRPRKDADMNLAHLLLGHGGQLGWIEWLVLDEHQLGHQHGEDRVSSHDSGDAVLHQHARTLDTQIKAAFDPHGVFGARFTTTSST